MLIFGKKAYSGPRPLPLAYAMYAFINVDNCERPLNKTTIESVSEQAEHCYSKACMTEHGDYYLEDCVPCLVLQQRYKCKDYIQHLTLFAANYYHTGLKSTSVYHWILL